MSTVYKITRKNFIRYLRDRIKNDDLDIEEYVSRQVGDIDRMITDLDKFECKYILEDMGEKVDDDQDVK